MLQSSNVPQATAIRLPAPLVAAIDAARDVELGETRAAALKRLLRLGLRAARGEAQR